MAILNVLSDEKKLDSLQILYRGQVVKIKKQIVTIDFDTLANANEIVKIQSIEFFKIDDNKFKAELLISRFCCPDESIIDIQDLSINDFFVYFHSQYSFVDK